MMQESSMELFRRSSHIAGGNATYVEDLYETYLLDPNACRSSGATTSTSCPRVESKTSLIDDVPHSALRERFARISKMRVRTEATVAHDSQATQHERKQVRVARADLRLPAARPPEGQSRPARACRARTRRGPGARFPRALVADLDTTFQVGSLHIGRE
jgi:2-oxoglutarate dehydrogenase E1 component